MSFFTVLIVAMSLLIAALGMLLARLVRGAEDFFVAGRKLSPTLLFATLLAANIGAGSTVAAAGLGYRDGLSAWWWVGSAGIGTLILGLFVAAPVWKLAADKNYLTVGDFLDDRYGRNLRTLIAALLLVGTLAILAGQLIALAWVLQVIAGTPKWFGAVIGGVVTVSYFTAGGLAGAAWINLGQLVILLLAFLLATAFGWNVTGGWEGISSVGSTGFTDFFGGGDSGWTLLFVLAPAFMISPGLLQKIFGAASASVARRATVVSALALLAFAFLPTLLGMMAASVYPALENRELALPTLLVSDLPLFVAVLGLAALFVADISSADAVLFMFSTSASRDLYRGLIRPSASDADVLRVARWSAIAAGAAATVMAIGIPTVMRALQFFYTLMSVSLFTPVLGGLVFSGLGKWEAGTSVIGGLLGTLVFTYLLDFSAGAATGYGIVLSIVLALLVALLRRTGESSA